MFSQYVPYVQTVLLLAARKTGSLAREFRNWDGPRACGPVEVGRSGSITSVRRGTAGAVRVLLYEQHPAALAYWFDNADALRGKECYFLLAYY
jgi:hypothetical protein